MIGYKTADFRHRTKVAAFDFEGTLVKPKDGRKNAKDADDWEWAHPNVPNVLKEHYKKGRCILVLTHATNEWTADQITKAMKTLKIPYMSIVMPAPSLVGAWNASMGLRKFKPEESFYVGTSKEAGRIGIQTVAAEEAFM